MSQPGASAHQSLLQLIDPKEVNVVTLEDPIEVELYGITQPAAPVAGSATQMLHGCGSCGMSG